MVGSIVRRINGQLILDDPTAMGVVAAVEMLNRDVALAECRTLFAANADRIGHFVHRMQVRGLLPSEVVIVVIDVDEPAGVGGALADALMPGHDWQQYRDQGQVPVARGLAGREGIEDMIQDFAPLAAARLRELVEPAVVVVTARTAATFPARLASSQGGA